MYLGTVHDTHGMSEVASDPRIAALAAVVHSIPSQSVFFQGRRFQELLVNLQFWSVSRLHARWKAWMVLENRHLPPVMSELFV